MFTVLCGICYKNAQNGSYQEGANPFKKLAYHQTTNYSIVTTVSLHFKMGRIKQNVFGWMFNFY